MKLLETIGKIQSKWARNNCEIMKKVKIELTESEIETLHAALSNHLMLIRNDLDRSEGAHLQKVGPLLDAMKLAALDLKDKMYDAYRNLQ